MKTTIHIFGRVSDIARVSSAIDDCPYPPESFLGFNNGQRVTKCVTAQISKIEKRVITLSKPCYSFEIVNEDKKDSCGIVRIPKGDVIIKLYKKASGGLGTPELVN